MKRRWLVLVILLLAGGSHGLLAQTTGKIAGTVTDEESGEPLPGVNLILEGTSKGAATNADGYYYIINIPPGTYTLRAQMIGYEIVRVTDVRVSVNLTSNISVEMKQTAIEGEEVIVEAEITSKKKSQTSSVRNVSSDQMDALPVENVESVIEMQAGVVDGHFRGGRDTEVTYLIDGIQVDDSFGGTVSAVNIETESVEDLEVITGTFNAEYGRAMSGVVNQVTKSGSNTFHGSVYGGIANYFTAHNDVFLGLNNSDLARNQDLKLHLSGPIIKDKITFFMNYRNQNNKNHLNGIRRFQVDDYSSFLGDSTQWISEHTGDSAYVPMNPSSNTSFTGKVAFNLFQDVRLSYLGIFNDDNWQGYNHQYKYNPDGMASSNSKSAMHAIQMNHMLGSAMFYDLKVSYLNDYYGRYVFKDPTDSGFVHDRYSNNAGPGFFTGGQEKSHEERTLNDYNVKFDLNWQINTNHSLKTGILYTQHSLDQAYSQIRNEYYGTEFEDDLYEPVVMSDSSIYSDHYKVEPTEFSGYIQDKMEFDEMVINLGIRYDYFEPNTVYPSDRRNPANQLDLPDSLMSTYPSADPKTQISPRFGLAYQLAESAILRFSYGHFFQMPPMYSLYQNNSFIVAPTSYQTTMGNAQLHAQKTVMYEIGLWQEIMPGMGFEVALFYRDIYDLLSTKVVTTYNQIKYGLYTNKDYGNVRGVEFKYDFNHRNFSSFINYTLQYTRANADNPTQTFNRAGGSMDPINRLIPMGWDQRHTFNVTASYGTERLGSTLTFYYNSGTAYTFAPIGESRLSRINLYPNNDYQPARYSVDLTGYYTVMQVGMVNLQLTWAVYNLFDTLNPVAVNSETGQAYTAIISESERGSHRSNFNDYEDRIENPSMYAAPRLVKIGLTTRF
ncbi:MAG: TonB-dependent receptor [Candidatus Marinimicrobia bacterium]|nr:TonB-dependent receptor [Candidatus Neomarinimicrobiota bacterium]MCF7829558.1 TonB-dependent receptor [Candidatus Neomarinimicrobiota bacterium]MCF7882008.1 TonB-dependent receptor [Candidatus Neomarinimicrobiota bacterium]